jgi:hypothetical protein
MRTLTSPRPTDPVLSNAPLLRSRGYTIVDAPASRAPVLGIARRCDGVRPPPEDASGLDHRDAPVPRRRAHAPWRAGESKARPE